MPDIHDMELDARPSPQDICEHNQDSIETGEEYYGREEHQYNKYFSFDGLTAKDLPSLIPHALDSIYGVF